MSNALKHRDIISMFKVRNCPFDILYMISSAKDLTTQTFLSVIQWWLSPPTKRFTKKPWSSFVGSHFSNSSTVGGHDNFSAFSIFSFTELCKMLAAVFIIKSFEYWTREENDFSERHCLLIIICTPWYLRCTNMIFSS